jgi:N-acetylmuramoyl-L-alanine amidase
MRFYKGHILNNLFYFILFISPFSLNSIEARDFIVVIDAGHGGHDPGAIGRYSKEKNINLNVALKLGQQIKEYCPDVKVIYTRKSDVFIPLDRRAEIANDAKADLFISIHTNALAKNNSVTGASTWTLGLAKSPANLEVAKRENSVILYESDYKTRYAGFNPNSAESYIIFEFMQDKYMSQSVHLASLIQKEFRQTCSRIDRGVHQAGFLVLKASAMPSILVELGFISNPNEEEYLNSKNGSSTLAKGIFRAFLTYKREQEIRLKGNNSTPLMTDMDSKTAPDTTNSQTTDQVKKQIVDQSKPQNLQKQEKGNITQPTKVVSTEKGVTDPVFKIQILTSSRLLSLNDKRFKGLKGIEYYKESGLYKYTYEASTNYNKVLKTKRELSSLFKDAFIIAWRDNEKMDVHTAINEFKIKNK